MPPEKRQRTVPCEKCREKHLKCDGANPCSSCKTADVTCVRVNKRLKFKRLVHVSEGKFTFDRDQPWVSQRQKGHETGTKSTSTQIESPPSNEGPRDDLAVAAASLLHSLSQVEPPRSRNDILEPTNAVVPVDDIDLVDHTSLASNVIIQSASTSPQTFRNDIEVQDVHSRSDPGPERSIQSPPQSNELGPATSNQYAHIHQLPTTSPLSNHTSLPEFSSFSFIPSNYSSEDSPYIDRTNRSISHGNIQSGRSDLEIQEACLVRCFAEHLAQNFDTADRFHHYINIVPLRALKNPLLLNAICAAAARFLTQKFLKHLDDTVVFDGIILPNLHKESAIHYHNSCIKDLMETLSEPGNPCSDDALTAITILRYHEQVDTHFTGSDAEAYSSVVQRVFRTQQYSISRGPLPGPDIYAAELPSLRHSAWLIALTQEIWSVSLYRRPFRLPLLSASDFYNNLQVDTADDFDWTTGILLWYADVLRFCFGTDDGGPTEKLDSQTRQKQWRALKGFLRRWDSHRPPCFEPLFHRDRDPDCGKYFPVIWQATDCHILALQHIELARVVIAVHDSKTQQRLGIGASAANQALEKVLRFATRRVCGMAWSKRHRQVAMTTAGVAISLCGEYFNDPGEQGAIVELLETLEREHAWPTSSVIGALQNAWHICQNSPPE